ncbi:MAG: hypothetical protein UY58_C0014G0005 [Candidatus Magasanikbacteria bacterium GW2011_GWA2_50_22]|uniref:Uncharacterized protein n=1 Tax=Candidatus Magasanikbacteria bacterium GW2011_GWA2_50_22 TaxID=1619043 RepID=A0A0G1WDV0_9BACT|nr:MAG: hypothetical protein UY58_C0014G0005 [Candidatus Magasanikbacteria bacterium GW2011_GWA2_50_22]
MPGSLTQSRKLEWKWIGIVFQFLLVLHLLPFVTMRRVFLAMSVDGAQVLFTGMWLIVGILLVTALSGFIAKEAIVWESIIASCAISALLLIGYHLIIKPAHLIISWPVVVSQTPPPSWAMPLIVPVLSLVGTWFGERAKSVWRIQD